MANNAKMNASNLKWSQVFLNDSMDLIKKQSATRRLFSKVYSPSMLRQRNSKARFYQRQAMKSKRYSPKRKVPATSSNLPEWKTEYDIWNMVTQAIDNNWPNIQQTGGLNKVIGVQGSSDNIRLIENRDDFNRQCLISANGMKTHVNELIGDGDSAADVSLKIKVKLVPIVEVFTIVRNSCEASYTFDSGSKEINNNAMECKNMENDSEIDDETLTFNVSSISHNNSSSDVFNSLDTTVTNRNTEWEYSDFYNDLQPEASSTFISNEKRKRSDVPTVQR